VKIPRQEPRQVRRRRRFRYGGAELEDWSASRPAWRGPRSARVCCQIEAVLVPAAAR